MANNTKNPTALLMQRLEDMIATGGKKGRLALLLQEFFLLNDYKTDLTKTLADRMVYDQLIMAAGVTGFFSGTFTPERCNLTGGSFTQNQSEHMLVTGFRIMQAVDADPAAINESDWQPGVADAIAKNAVLNVTINGQRVISQLGLTAFDPNALSATNSGATDDNRGFFYLMEPVIWPGQTTIEANVKLLPGATPTEDLALRLEVHGPGFIGN